MNKHILFTINLRFRIFYITIKQSQGIKNQYLNMVIISFILVIN